MMNVADTTLVGVGCFKFYNAFFIIFSALFGTQDAQSVPGGFFAPFFSCLAVNFCNFFAFFTGRNDEWDFLFYIRRIACSHQAFCGGSLNRSFDNWFTTFAVGLSRTTRTQIFICHNGIDYSRLRQPFQSIALL